MIANLHVMYHPVYADLLNMQRHMLQKQIRKLFIQMQLYKLPLSHHTFNNLKL